MLYCEFCRLKHGLNKRVTQIFGAKCGLCERTYITCYHDSDVTIDNDLEVILFKKLVPLTFEQYNKKEKKKVNRIEYILVDAFSNYQLKRRLPMTLSYKTTVTISNEVIVQVSNHILNELLLSLEHSMNDDQIQLVKKTFERITNNMVEETKTINGIKISKRDLMTAARYLEKGQAISAIRSIRDATGCGLREAKELIDCFSRDERGANNLIRLFENA